MPGAPRKRAIRGGGAQLEGPVPSGRSPRRSAPSGAAPSGAPGASSRALPGAGPPPSGEGELCARPQPDGFRNRVAAVSALGPPHCRPALGSPPHRGASPGTPHWRAPRAGALLPSPPPTSSSRAPRCRSGAGENEERVPGPCAPPDRMPGVGEERPALRAGRGRWEKGCVPGVTAPNHARAAPPERVEGRGAGVPGELGGQVPETLRPRADARAAGPSAAERGPGRSRSETGVATEDGDKDRKMLRGVPVPGQRGVRAELGGRQERSLVWLK